MKLRTYHAKTMAEALTLVKSELGAGAVILQTRSVRVGGILGFGAKPVIEVVATNDTSIAPQRRAPSTSSPPSTPDRAPRPVRTAQPTRQTTPMPPRAAPARPAPPQPARSSLTPDLQGYDRAGRLLRTIPVGVEAPQPSASSSPAAPLHSHSRANIAPSPAQPHAESAPATMLVRTRRPSSHSDLPSTTEAPDAPDARAAQPRLFEDPLPTAPALPSTAPARARKPSSRRAPASPPPSSDPAASAPHDAEQVRHELALIRRMVSQVLQSTSTPAVGSTASPASLPAPPASEVIFNHYLNLLEQQVSREIADQLVAHVRESLTAAEQADHATVRQTLLSRLADLIPVSASAAPLSRAADGRPTTIALVGPTGVGKTTTIAKLAATYKLRHGRRVGLITADTYRIAAVEQLRTYATIIGLPMKVVATPHEMADACASLADCDAVLIDTAGRSPGDSSRLAELRAMIHAADPHETHLVLSLAASERAILHAAEQFAVVKPSRVIFTKLDEAVGFGVLVNVAQRINASLSFVTTGQEVPDQIEPGRADRLARLVLDGHPPQSPLSPSSSSPSSARAAELTQHTEHAT